MQILVQTCSLNACLPLSSRDLNVLRTLLTKTHSCPLVLAKTVALCLLTFCILWPAYLKKNVRIQCRTTTLITFWLWDQWAKGSFTFTFKTRSEEKIREPYCSAKTPPAVFLSVYEFLCSLFAVVSNHISVNTLKMQSWPYFQWVNTVVILNSSLLLMIWKKSSLEYTSGLLYLVFNRLGLYIVLHWAAALQKYSATCSRTRQCQLWKNSVSLPVFLRIELAALQWQASNFITLHHVIV